jgi:hypothetical protein
MEQGGHYYTVYYTSLAVGFNENVAYRHAVLSQMPDQVNWMDAAHMQTQQCRGYLGGRETDFNNVLRYVPPGERYTIQYGLHSLPERDLDKSVRSSAFQRSYTTNDLLQQSPISLKFGLLLHRLGDTYAHSKIGNENTMYTVTDSARCITTDRPTESFGHLFDMHDPDYPFLREDLFFSYLYNLYFVLNKKAAEPINAKYRRTKNSRPFHEVKGDFKILFTRLAGRAKIEQQEAEDTMNQYSQGGYGTLPPTSNDTKARWLIEEIRAAALRTMHVQMRKYSPEKEAGTSLDHFLAGHPELKGLNINGQNLTDTVNAMVPKTGGASGKW